MYKSNDHHFSRSSKLSKFLLFPFYWSLLSLFIWFKSQINIWKAIFNTIDTEFIKEHAMIMTDSSFLRKKNVASPTQNYDGYQMCGHRSLITLYWCLVIQNILFMFIHHLSLMTETSIMDQKKCLWAKQKMGLVSTFNEVKLSCNIW